MVYFCICNTRKLLVYSVHPRGGKPPLPPSFRLVASPRMDAAQRMLDAHARGYWKVAHGCPNRVGVASCELPHYLPDPLNHTADTCRAAHGWVHLVGDSTVRFLFAALLAIHGVKRVRMYQEGRLVSASTSPPVHILPDDHPCSFASWGLHSNSTCTQMWHGACQDENKIGCVYDSGNAAGTRISFECACNASLKAAAYDVICTSILVD